VEIPAAFFLGAESAPVPDDPRVDEWTTMPAWDGERMDLDWVVGTLI